ncbi:hypothetical protein M0R45_001507 [Rubus argutus]|uniref:U-box domain-containing protein n=1 Tax=Rubus argutus TaxID=59490 RepID=A0AAW1VKX6_RUBAR
MIDKGGIAVVSSLLGPFTSHVVGSEAIAILVKLTLDSESRMNLMQPAKISGRISVEGLFEDYTKYGEATDENFRECTQYALSILSAVCKLAPEECSSIALDAGLAAKLLLVIQSCDPVLKQQSAELLKLCSLNYSDTIFISKCKLTRTIQ